ncbi:hypothetical protein B0H16DRAFT_1799705 [Mycena metata]|uniref:Uncharacterized protein n=1 Tax=Mycena metata TaxID=1033252 RepID=A0AAD7JGC4_9AGAR|nr:hypothetical protein B0H16DRAFT_1799705 [Mycena metata]
MNNDSGIVAARRGGPSVQPQSSATTVTPHERRMLEAMKAASSEQFQYIRQMAKQRRECGRYCLSKRSRLLCRHCVLLREMRQALLESRRRNMGGKLLLQQRSTPCDFVRHYMRQFLSQCQTRDWKPISKTQPGVYHKDWCKVIKDEYMPQLPYFQAQLTQFPWGRLEQDGTFSHKFLHARFDVLDADYRKAGNSNCGSS